MKKTSKFILAITLVLICTCMIIYPERYIPSAKKGILLWANNVLPCLFPFFFCTTTLSKLGSLKSFRKSKLKTTEKIFRLSETIKYVFLTSITSGYPVGAKMISDLKQCGEIDKDEATRAACLCSTSGPVFVCGTVGATMLGDKKTGFTILFYHIISAIICGIIVRNYGNFKTDHNVYKLNKNNDNSLYDCIYSSVISVLTVGGFICLFYILSDIVTDFKILSPATYLASLFLEKDVANGLIKGILECTNGCHILSSIKTREAVACICSLISFGGISVLMQSIVFLKKADVNLKVFLTSKIIQAAISFSLCYLLYR